MRDDSLSGNMLVSSRRNLIMLCVHCLMVLCPCCLSATLYTHQVDPVVPYTFPTVDSYLKIPSEPGNRLRVNFDFRSYNREGLLFTHDLQPTGKVMVSVPKLAICFPDISV